MGTSEQKHIDPGRAKRPPDARRHLNRSVIHWFMLTLILLISLWVRMDDLVAWHHQPHRAFYNSRPILINFDGYYYLSLARDLMQHRYARTDPLRGVPDPQPRPWPPPILSVLAAAAAVMTPLSLDWIGILLPPCLGLLLALPLYLMGRLFGGPLMALVATCVGLCSEYYVYRSNSGWFDTDCLNVTFAFLITYLFLCFGTESRRRRFLFLCGGLILSGFFLLWWDQNRSSVLLICLASLLIVLLLFYRPKGPERWIALAVAIAVTGALVLWQGPQVVVAPFQKASGMLGYIAKDQSDAFPNTGLSVFEQKRLGLEELIAKTTGHSIPFLIGVLGLAGLFFHQKRKAAALLLLFTLGCLSFFFARRFLIFLNPFIALGLGFVAQQVWNLRQRWPYLSLGAPALAVGLCLFPVQNSLGKVYWPKEIPPLIEGMDRLAQNSAEDAVVWAWWDHGYPMLYWSQRATINDGSLHSGLRTVCNAIPLTDQSQQSAANFMHFYTRRGNRGLLKIFDALGSPGPGLQLAKRVFAAGPGRADGLLSEAGLAPLDQWRDFFFPPRQRELYLYLDLRMARTTYWWSWFGTWDAALKEGRHAKFKLIRNCRQDGTMIKSPELEVDLAQGRLTYAGRTHSLAQATILDGTRQTRTTYSPDGETVFIFQKQTQTGALMDPSFARSLFNQLYMLADADPAYFSLVAQRFPYYQIWKVTADR